MKKKITITVFLCWLSLVFLVGCFFHPAGGATLTVNQRGCIGCRKCAEVCSTDAIRIVGNKALIAPDECTECAKCVEVCPVDAIQ